MQHLPSSCGAGEVGLCMNLSTAKYLFASVGLVLVLGSFVVYQHTASFIHRATRTQGTVTALVRQQSTNYRNNGSIDRGMPVTYSYLPIVRFQVAEQQIQFRGSVATSPPAWHVGETVDVLYLESNPWDARIESFTSLWLLPMIFGGIGAVFLAIGARLILGSRPGAARAQAD